MSDVNYGYGEWVVIQRGDRLRLVSYGFVFGFATNLSFTIPNVFRSNFYLGLAIAIGVIANLLFIIALATRWVKGTKVRKTRLFFFGISLISFLFAFGDLMQFTLGSHLISISSDYPYILIGDISFVSMLASFAIGGLFSVIERLLELHSKKPMITDSA